MIAYGSKYDHTGYSIHELVHLDEQREQLNCMHVAYSFRRQVFIGLERGAL